jgi:hypothetical protein
MEPQVDSPRCVGAFRPRVLMWECIMPLLRPPEVDEVRRVLGNRVIERNEVRAGVRDCLQRRRVRAVGGMTPPRAAA